MLRLEMAGTDIQNVGPGETAATVGAVATPAPLLDKGRLDRNQSWAAICAFPAFR